MTSLNSPSLPKTSIQIDSEGYFHFGETRIEAPQQGLPLFENLIINESGHLISVYQGQPILVEPYDEPFIAQNIEKNESHEFSITMPYGYAQKINLESLCLDEWDRFHGESSCGVPFVLGEKAQDQFFNLVDEFDDDSVTIAGQKINTDSWLSPNHETKKESFWTHIYNTEDPRWDLKVPHPSLEPTIHQLKLNKCRVLVLGCGTGTDAALLASQGHIVTAIDISPEAIKRAKDKYKNQAHLSFFCKDLFEVTPEEFGQFDLIFEHTIYCAISPDLRNSLVKKWRQMLTDTGQVLGVFFVMHRRFGPPFGGSEWEIHQRLKNDFRFLYWTRSKLSPGSRLGKELIVFAQRR